MADKPEMTFGARFGPYFAWAWLAFWMALLVVNWWLLRRAGGYYGEK